MKTPSEKPTVTTKRLPGRPPKGPTPQAALADALGCDARTLRNWRKLAESPVGDDFDAWTAFRDAHGLGRVRSGELAELKKEVERERLRKLRRENAVAEGSLIPKDVVAAAIIGKAHGFARILRYELEQNLPALLVGQPIAEIRRELRDTCDRVTVRYNAVVSADEIAAEALGASPSPSGEAGN